MRRKHVAHGVIATRAADGLGLRLMCLHRELESVIAGGLVAGAIAAAIVYAVLRFDARTIPGYVVAATIVSAGEDAALDGTAAGWAEFAVYAAVAVAIGWAALRYIEPSGTPRDAAPPT